MDILIFSEKPEVAEFFSRVLRLRGHKVESEERVEMALKRIVSKNYDWMIVDAISQESSFNFCKTAKFHCPHLKIMSIASSEVHSGSLSEQADVYLPYPMDEWVLIENMERFHRDHYRIDELPKLQLGDLIIYPSSYEAFREGRKIPLRKKEFQLLEFMMRHQNRVINRHSMLEYLWSYNNQAITNTLDVHISSLRKKVDNKYSVKMIKTVYGTGYKLSDSAE